MATSRTSRPGWPNAPAGPPPGSTPRPWSTGSGRYGCSSSGSRNGAGTKHHHGSRIFLGDRPRQDHPLPKALDDNTAAKLLHAARADRRLLVRVTIEVLLRTGLRVSEFTGLRADAVVQIGNAPWLHVPVGKLREDRYLPLLPPWST